MRTSVAQIIEILGDERHDSELNCRFYGSASMSATTGVSIDSRTLVPGEVFFALKGNNTDGHDYIREALHKGASLVVVETGKCKDIDELSTIAPVLSTSSVVKALQHLASWHRQHYYNEVLAVTGSNGKTLFKDALKCIFSRRSIVASPGSYNGSLGLPLSVLQTNQQTDLGIFEVGVAGPGEMPPLESIASPSFGVLINIGMAHIAAYDGRQEIAQEKLKLFQNIPQNGWVLIPDFASEPLMELANDLNCRVYQLGKGDKAVHLELVQTSGNHTTLRLRSEKEISQEFTVKTCSPEIITDLHFAASAASLLGMPLVEIAASLDSYDAGPTRMEVWTSPNGIKIINDSHSSDPISVGAALKTAATLSANENDAGKPLNQKRIFVFSGMRELGDASLMYHEKVGLLAAEHEFTHLYIIRYDDDENRESNEKALLQTSLDATVAGFKSKANKTTNLQYLDIKQIRGKLLEELSPGDTVLYKGPRAQGMTDAVNDLIGSISQRCIKIDLTSIKENIAQIRRIGQGTKVMAMLKALAYGTELEKISYWTANLGVNCIGVSAASEGVSLRRIGYSDEIFVFLSDKNDVEDIVFNNLTPILYSVNMVNEFEGKLKKIGNPTPDKSVNVHLKVDTGMHRLGIALEELIPLARQIKSSKHLKLTGICTHLAAADDPQHDDFTHHQLDCFDEAKRELEAAGFEDLAYHAANSAAAIRFKRAHYDIVRPGLALYGLYPSQNVKDDIVLSLAISVTSHVIDIRTVQSHESIGYARQFRTQDKARRIACVPFGYDDGLPWSLNRSGSGGGHVNIAGKDLSIVGRISMDQILVDVTEAPNIAIGDEVLIYGRSNGFEIRPEALAEKANMIPHELLVRLGNRVQRIFIETS